MNQRIKISIYMKFNNVVIGSSPVCLLETIYSSQQGNQTCIIDDAEKLGGAWKKLAPDGSGIENVEIGCHILEKDKHVFRFFEDNLKLKLVKLEPQPKITYGSKWTKYNFKNLLFIFRDVKLYFNKKYGFSHFRMNLYLFFKELAQLNLKYYSFQNDSIALSEKLNELIHKTDATIKLSTKITSINVNTSTKLVEIITNKNEKITTDKLTISYTTSVEELIINSINRTEIFQKEKQEFVHLHLLISDENLKEFSYLRVYKNLIVHRISDMSKQVTLNKGEHLICVGIYASAYNKIDKEEILREVFQLFDRLELVSKKYKIINQRWNSYSMITTNYKDLKKLEKESNGLIEVLYTPDITLGLRYNLHKFKKIKT